MLIIDDRIAGYYTLTSTGIRVDDLPEDALSKFKLPRYPMLGGTLIGRLARDVSFRGEGIGELLLIDALKRAAKSRVEIASFAVVVDAINDKAVNFYKKYGFVEFRDEPMRLFIPMSTVDDLFAI